jgi:hypothetical protein
MQRVVLRGDCSAACSNRSGIQNGVGDGNNGKYSVGTEVQHVATEAEYRTAWVMGTTVIYYVTLNWKKIKIC